MADVRSTEDGVCTGCGTAITNTELVTEGVIKVLDRAGPMLFHLRCFELRCFELSDDE
jgi:hypothetical protein